MTQRTVSMLFKVPEELHDALRAYAASHPDWDDDRIAAAALSLFLLQDSSGMPSRANAQSNYRRAARVYLEAQFNHHMRN